MACATAGIFPRGTKDNADFFPYFLANMLVNLGAFGRAGRVSEPRWVNPDMI